MKFLRMAALLLLLTVVFSSAVGCSVKPNGNVPSVPSDDTQGDNGNVSGGDNSGSNDGSETDREVVIGDKNLILKDWDGRSFKVLTQKSVTSSGLNSDDLVGDAEGDTVSKALYERNRFIQDTFNVKIERMGRTDHHSIIGDIFRSDIGEYDAVALNVYSALRRCQYYVDLTSEAEYINLSEPWWDQSLLADTAVEGRNYFVFGDITTADDRGTACIIFDKSLAESTEGIGINGLYDTVLNNEWTLEKMKLLAAKLENEPNAGGNPYSDIDLADPYRYGIVINTGEMAAQRFLESSGVKSYEYNSELKKWESNYYWDEAFENVLYEIGMNLLFDRENDKVLEVAKIRYNGDTWTDKLFPSFAADKILFYVGNIYETARINALGGDIGVLPLPMISDSQEGYSGAIRNDVFCYAVSTCAEDYDFSGFMLEALCYYSSPEHFGDGSLRSVFMNSIVPDGDEHDAMMLELIFGNRRLDIGYNLDLENFRMNINSYMNSTTHNWKAEIVSDCVRMDEAFATWTQGIYD